MDEGLVSRRTLLTGAAGTLAVLGGGTALAKYEVDVHPGLRRLLGFCGSTPSIPRDTQHQIVTGTLRSEAMGRPMPYALAVPISVAQGPDLGGPPVPLVVALPGDNGGALDFAHTMGLPSYATRAGFSACFVSPGDVGSSYYHPRRDGTDMLAFLTDELIPHAERSFRVGGARTRRAAYGVSMGGFGALLLTQQRPDLFAAAVAESPAVFQTYDAAITGHPGTFDSEADWEQYGLWNHLSSMGRVPVRIACGDADPFAATDRQLLQRIPHAVGGITSGCHEHSFWRRNAADDVAFLKNHLFS